LSADDRNGIVPHSPITAIDGKVRRKEAFDPRPRPNEMLHMKSSDHCGLMRNWTTKSRRHATRAIKKRSFWGVVACKSTSTSKPDVNATKHPIERRPDNRADVP